ncbi:MAG: dicarboxylate/amino acid:cation symporter [Pirellulaceae bacterium]
MKIKLALHWQILIGMALGVLFGVIAVKSGLEGFTENFVQPFGTIFINLLKLIAVPLIVASLIKGVSDLQDISKLSSMGGRTVALYLFTTVVAVTLGLLIVNVMQPGKSVSEETRQALLADEAGQAKAAGIIESASEQKKKGPLQPLVDLVPDNIVGAATSNGNMLQVIFFAIFFGVGLILVRPNQAKPVKDFFDGLNEVILKLIDLIMLAAPFGVFALMAGLIVTTKDWNLLLALLKYGLCVIVGLAILLFVFYPTLVRMFTGKSYRFFFSGIAPAQLLAFSTSSSAATLPVTMERVEEHLGVDREVSSFVLPIGATVNMDGTSLYQAVAAVFIAQAMGIGLTLNAQLTIVLTATLASIGSAAVPGAGMVMLVIVLGAAGIPESGLALIFAVDRILDMCRTTVNVTGDATVSMLVAQSVGKLGDPHVKEWDDEYLPHHPEKQAKQ